MLLWFKTVLILHSVTSLNRGSEEGGTGDLVHGLAGREPKPDAPAFAFCTSSRMP